MISLLVVISCTPNEQDDPSARTAASDWTIDTFAGGPEPGFDGDGGDAKAAKLAWITGLSIDLDDNMYIADGAANVIRKINTSNKISTIAGTFLGWNVVDPLQYSGDGGPATSAHLNVPMAAAADASGNVYICDAGNGVLRKINTSGIISTAMTDVWNPQGITADRHGNVYVADTQNHVIRKISATGEVSIIAGMFGQAGYTGDGGPAPLAKLSMPIGIVADDVGNVYITDNNAAIRMISAEGHITTIAGTGVVGFSGDGGPANKAQLSAPRGLDFVKGGIVFADAGNSRIRWISPETHIIETIAGTGEFGYSGDGGDALEAKIANPWGLAVDSKENIYVADAEKGVVRIIKSVK